MVADLLKPSVYRYSRAMYRELVAIGQSRPGGQSPSERQALLAACESTIIRLGAMPARAALTRSLFREVRGYFPLAAQREVWQAIYRHVSSASEVAGSNVAGLDGPTWVPRDCRATTRRGTPCRRQPVAANGYCPSHQHLAETEGSPFERALASTA
jgi:hypothetical protein